MTQTLKKYPQKGGSDYDLFFSFIDAYSRDGFKGIDPNEPLMIELEEMMEANRQFFYIADAMQLSILFTSKGSKQMLGIDPDDLNFYHFMEVTHPDEIARLNLGRPKIVSMAQDLYTAKEGVRFISADYRMRNTHGVYTNILVQGYLVYTTIPRKTVFFLKLHTNIDWWKKKEFGFHYFLGEDLSYFRYPDEELLNMGMILSKREFEILQLVEQGLSSEQIADKLFLSVNTVHTHRCNMLKKTGKESVSELVFSFKERGLM